ncbi:MAG: hypothetical protein FJ267_20175 [Planctomycetes bacterium]|nr:hypothetical protein [Planctomycetota bacterium]
MTVREDWLMYKEGLRYPIVGRMSQSFSPNPSSAIETIARQFNEPKRVGWALPTKKGVLLLGIV